MLSRIEADPDLPPDFMLARGDGGWRLHIAALFSFHDALCSVPLEETSPVGWLISVIADGKPGRDVVCYGANRSESTGESTETLVLCGAPATFLADAVIGMGDVVAAVRWVADGMVSEGFVLRPFFDVYHSV